MKREITLGQLISVGVTLLIAMASGWITLNNKVSAHAADIYYLQQKINTYDKQMERLENKIDKMIEKQEEILVQLAGKQNK